MTTLQLKEILINRINEIDDLAFLNEIKSILDSKLKGRILKLSPEQFQEINESQMDIRNGHFIEQAELDKAIEKWISSK